MNFLKSAFTALIQSGTYILIMVVEGLSYYFYCHLLFKSKATYVSITKLK